VKKYKGERVKGAGKRNWNSGDVGMTLDQASTLDPQSNEPTKPEPTNGRRGMDRSDVVDVAVRFIESINRRDFDQLRDLMADNHKMIDAHGEVEEGHDVSVKMIEDYAQHWPHFQIHISDIHLIDHTVVVIGRTTGSCADKTPAEEIRERLIYVIHVEDGFVASFRYALVDTDLMRNGLGVRDANRITR
jgi:hypothetical protein